MVVQYLYKWKEISRKSHVTQESRQNLYLNVQNLFQASNVVERIQSFVSISDNLIKCIY